MPRSVEQTGLQCNVNNEMKKQSDVQFQRLLSGLVYHMGRMVR